MSNRAARGRREGDLRARKTGGGGGDWAMEVEMVRLGRRIDRRANELRAARTRVSAISDERGEMMLLETGVYWGFILESERERDILGWAF